MNIKFRMPKLWDNVTFQGTLKEIVLSIIATTISIVLTFGTAHYIEEKEKKAAARQTAMMVIHDIENSIEELRYMAKYEEKYLELTQQVQKSMAEKDSMDQDTVWAVFNYLASSSDKKKLYNFDESSERVFLSSQDSWKNIDNAKFIDLVQGFYAYRHKTYDYLNNSPMWQKPISSQVIHQYQLDHVNDQSDFYQLLKEHINSKEVQFYIRCSITRQQYLNEVADYFEFRSNACKFIIGITDEELEEYIKNRNRTGRNVKEQEIIGRWIMQSSDDRQDVIEYFDDHTYTQTQTTHYAYSGYTGRVDFKYIFTGTWELRDDTLYDDQHPGFKFEMDHSHITPNPGQEHIVEELLKEWEQQGKEYQKSKAGGEIKHNAYEATINASGNKIEMRWTEKDNEGKDREHSDYFTRDKGK